MGGIATTVAVGPGAAANTHPVKVAPSRLRYWLSGLEIRRPRSDIDTILDSSAREIPLFNPTRLPEVAKALSRQLSRAEPRQDVAIRIEQYRNALFGVERDPRVTAFRAFVSDGQLNLIFGTVDQNPTADVPGGSGPAPMTAPKPRLDRAANYRKEIGSRAQAGKGQAALVLPAYAHFAKPSRHDWVVIDMSAAGSASLPNTSRATGSAAHAPAAEPHDAPAGAARRAALHARLRELKTLREQNLIGERLYQEETKKVLDEYLGAGVEP